MTAPTIFHLGRPQPWVQTAVGAYSLLLQPILCLAAASTPTLMAGSPVLSIKNLGFPWQTDDPFLFCVYHNDTFPAGDHQMAPAVQNLWRGRNRGADFGSKEWNMYHGEKVPGFPRHPHRCENRLYCPTQEPVIATASLLSLGISRGFETVTVVRHGKVDHADGLGCSGRFGDGDVQVGTQCARAPCSARMPRR